MERALGLTSRLASPRFVALMETTGEFKKYTKRCEVRGTELVHKAGLPISCGGKKSRHFRVVPCVEVCGASQCSTFISLQAPLGSGRCPLKPSLANLLLPWRIHRFRCLEVPAYPFCEPIWMIFRQTYHRCKRSVPSFDTVPTCGPTNFGFQRVCTN